MTANEEPTTQQEQEQHQLVQSLPSHESRKESAQLDLLLLKAESYSKFIFENQKRSQAVMISRQAAAGSISGSNIKSKKRSSPAANEKSNKRSKASHKAEVTETTQTTTNDAVENETVQTLQQPPNLCGGSLMTHQLEGLQWLLSLWENGLNGILADEMGLGKTIQIIALIAHLRYHNTSGPYLIIGPLATLGNWMKEFQKWLPDCPILLYHGDKTERANLRRQKLPINSQKSLDFPIVITSFEMCMADRIFLEKYLWQYIIMDEGHRIKNRKCKLFRELKSLRSISRLLLTGTPIQNSLEELWSLLNFCSPAIFDDLEVFHSWFDFKNIGSDTKVEDILDEEEKDKIVTKLHEILRPFVLRRLKRDTLKDLIKEKKEIVIYCGLTPLQSEYYSRLLDGTLRETLLSMGVNAKAIGSQLNPTMQQRKVCNHPFLFGDIPGKNGEPIQDNDPMLLISTSGKFKVLHRMLPLLYEEGHKVILFSQMTEVLNLVEDYLNYMDYSFFRLDGMTKLADRQTSIDAFNEPNSKVHFFLLSTRAGGLGVNLTAADTAILFDSDWNPHVDAQAQDRCHRIGQQKNVVVYRLLTMGSIEIDMMKKQVSKKKLERLTIQGGDFRKAGMKKAITLDELKHLLEDDVRNLSRQEQKKDGNGEWLHREISDEELELILDRDSLFADPNSGESVPTEGEMYDIIQFGAESILQALD